MTVSNSIHEGSASSGVPELIVHRKDGTIPSTFHLIINDWSDHGIYDLKNKMKNLCAIHGDLTGFEIPQCPEHLSEAEYRHALTIMAGHSNF